MYTRINQQDKSVLIVRLLAGITVSLFGLSVGLKEFLGACFGVLVACLFDYLALWLIYKPRGARCAGEIIKALYCGFAIKVAGGALCIWVFLALVGRSQGLWFALAYISMAAAVALLPIAMVTVRRNQI